MCVTALRETHSHSQHKSAMVVSGQRQSYTISELYNIESKPSSLIYVSLTRGKSSYRGYTRDAA